MRGPSWSSLLGIDAEVDDHVDGFVELGFFHLLEDGEGGFEGDRRCGHEFEGFLVAFTADFDGHVDS